MTVKITDEISLASVEMTRELMLDLEKRGLIVRMAPGTNELDAKKGETLTASLYQPLDGFGPHKMMAVTVNRIEFSDFGTHPENEDFFLIGDPNTKPLYLVVALCMEAESCDLPDVVMGMGEYKLVVKE
ncbi:MAG: hypothetical protein PF489_15825 [Salinivirgaceae bacterium]|jgi:hypothetical protein|nr:hypothetical protein [Salinivirgaceae bacterium]